jgi:predicted ester cyclase
MYDAWNRGDMESFYSYIDEDVVDHNRGEDEKGLDGVRKTLDHIREAFPDYRYTVEEVIVEGDRTAAILGCEATHRGSFFGYAPTGKKARWVETRWCTWKNGKVTEHRAVGDSLSLMRQLGLVADTQARDSKRTSW